MTSGFCMDMYISALTHTYTPHTHSHKERERERREGGKEGEKERPFKIVIITESF